MNRRSLLRQAGTLCTLLVAGCTGDSADGGNDTGGTATPTGTSTPAPSTPTGTPTTSPTPDGRRVVAASLTVGNVTSGQQVDAVDVAFEDPSSVAVSGTIWGSDGCKTAELGSVAYDAGPDTLTVAVVTTDREGTTDTACTEAIVEIDYEATVELAGGLPGTVAVTHDGRAVRTVRRETPGG